MVGFWMMWSWKKKSVFFGILVVFSFFLGFGFFNVVVVVFWMMVGWVVTKLVGGLFAGDG